MVLKRLVFDDAVAASLQMRGKRAKIIHDKGWMGFPGRGEIRLNARMDFQAPLFEPASALRGKVGRSGHFAGPEHAPVKCPCVILAAGGHRELNVIDATDLHV